MVLDWLLGSDSSSFVTLQTAESVLALELRNVVNSQRAEHAGDPAGLILPQVVHLSKDGFRFLNMYLDEFIGVLVRDVMPVNFGHAGINEVLRQLFPDKNTDLGRFAWRDAASALPPGAVAAMQAAAAAPGGMGFDDHSVDSTTLFTMGHSTAGGAVNSPTTPSSGSGPVMSSGASFFGLSTASGGRTGGLTDEQAETAYEKKMLKYLRAECSLQGQSAKASAKRAKAAQTKDDRPVNALVVAYVTSILEILMCYVMRKALIYVMEINGYVPSPINTGKVKPLVRKSITIEDEHVIHVITVDYDLADLYDRTKLEPYLTCRLIETMSSGVSLVNGGVTVNMEAGQRQLRAKIVKARKMYQELKGQVYRNPLRGTSTAAPSSVGSDSGSIKSGTLGISNKTAANSRTSLPSINTAMAQAAAGVASAATNDSESIASSTKYISPQQQAQQANGSGRAGTDRWIIDDAAAQMVGNSFLAPPAGINGGVDVEQSPSYVSRSTHVSVMSTNTFGQPGNGSPPDHYYSPKHGSFQSTGSHGGHYPQHAAHHVPALPHQTVTRGHPLSQDQQYHPQQHQQHQQQRQQVDQHPAWVQQQLMRQQQQQQQQQNTARIPVSGRVATPQSIDSSTMGGAHELRTRPSQNDLLAASGGVSIGRSRSKPFVPQVPQYPQQQMTPPAAHDSAYGQLGSQMQMYDSVDKSNYLAQSGAINGLPTPVSPPGASSSSSSTGPPPIPVSVAASTSLSTGALYAQQLLQQQQQQQPLMQPQRGSAPQVPMSMYAGDTSSGSFSGIGDQLSSISMPSSDMQSLHSMHMQQVKELQRQQLEQMQTIQRQQMELIQLQQRLELERQFSCPSVNNRW
ncbi:hypothetical protein GQ42DRAFT_27162 [Ramicandelaber brevisporus]|nr:hypothetical protein GQ42DRAFT_27162 [Ramicandelaber brevisporus]